MSRRPDLARRLFDRIEPVHAVTYFAPEARAALDGLGYRGFWMGYFAARSAPLGRVPADVVTAIFYNFAPEQVAKALPAAWALAPPESALQAREESAVAALDRCGVRADEQVRAAASLAAKAARDLPVEGRPLYAANRSLDWPDDPVAVLWHATTLLREHRGDGHVAVLAAAGLSGRECNVLHAAAGRVPRAMIMRSRHYDDAQWQQSTDRLARRGLLDPAGELTSAGHAFKRQIEDSTDALALCALDALDDNEVESLFQALTPITRAVIAAEIVPSATPMGLSRDDLEDGSAHLA